MSYGIKKSLVTAALCQAIDKENPKAGLTVHTDRRAQFTSKNFVNLLE